MTLVRRRSKICKKGLPFERMTHPTSFLSFRDTRFLQDFNSFRFATHVTSFGDVSTTSLDCKFSFGLVDFVLSGARQSNVVAVGMRTIEEKRMKSAKGACELLTRRSKLTLSTNSPLDQLPRTLSFVEDQFATLITQSAQLLLVVFDLVNVFNHLLGESFTFFDDQTSL